MSVEKTIPEEIAERIDRHFLLNPKHGSDCACMDQIIRDLRNHLKPLLSSVDERVLAWQKKDKHKEKVYRAMENVLHRAADTRRY